MKNPNIEDLKSMVDDPTWDKTLLVKYLAEMNKDWVQKHHRLAEEFSLSNGRVPSTLNEITSDFAAKHAPVCNFS